MTWGGVVGAGPPTTGLATVGPWTFLYSIKPIYHLLKSALFRYHDHSANY